MKRFISLVALTIGLLMIFDSCAVGRRKDVVIAYEHLNADASFKQFKKATKTNQVAVAQSAGRKTTRKALEYSVKQFKKATTPNQIEILSALVRRANYEYLKCQTIDDLYAVKEQLDLIKFYNENADQKSITVTNDIRKLDNSITQTEAEFKGEKVIEGSRTIYRDRGQEMR